MTDPAPEREGRWRFALRVAFSVGLLAAVLLVVDRQELVRTVSRTRPSGFAAILALSVADRLLMAWKWWLLLRSREIAVGLGQAVKAYFVSSYAGLFLPSTVGADAVRAVVVRGRESGYRIVASIALERGVGFLAQGLLAAFSVVLLLRLEVLPGTTLRNLGWMIAGLLVVGALSLPISFRLAGVVAGRWRERQGLPGRVGRLAEAYGEWRGERRIVWVFFLLSFAEAFVPPVLAALAAWALRLEIPFVLLLATVPLILMVARLPITVGGIGVFEASFVWLGGQLGIPEAHAFAIGLVNEAAQILTVLPGAFLGPSAAVAPEEPDDAEDPDEAGSAGAPS